jgi:acyl-coenzyme A thioesterase PaaI-like protein
MTTETLTLADRPGALAGALEAALLRVADDGRPMTIASLAVDYAAPAGASITVDAGIDRATRSLVFARAEARNAAGAIAATASAVLRVVGV